MGPAGVTMWWWQIVLGTILSAFLGALVGALMIAVVNLVGDWVADTWWRWKWTRRP